MNFQWDFLKVLRRKISFFGHPSSDIFAVLTIECSSGWQKTTSIAHSGLKIKLRWPLNLHVHLDLVEYREGSYLCRHVDMTDILTGHERRLVLVLRNADEGGELRADEFIMNLPRIKIFDTRVKHEVTKVKKGRRLVVLAGIYVASTHNRP